MPEPTSKPIRKIVFDMGGVLMNFDGPVLRELVSRTRRRTRRCCWARSLEPRCGRSWTRAPSRTRPCAATRSPTYRSGCTPTGTSASPTGPSTSEPFSATNDLAIRLKGEGYGIYLPLNASTRIMEQLGHAPVLPHLDGYVVSAMERLMKPDPAIYQLLCVRYDLDPAECVFVDDNLDNCIGAEAAGMRSFHFTREPGHDAAALEAFVRELS